MLRFITEALRFDFERYNKIQRQRYNNMVKAMDDKNDRVLKLLDENIKLYPNDYRSSSRYCDAFVDGQIAIESKQAQRLYNKVMSAQENEREIVMLFGKTACEILEALDSYEKEKTVMTREEAIKKLETVTSHFVDAKILIDCLEALSLIKFDKPKRKYIFFPHPDEGKDNVSVYQDDVIKTLKEYGYTIHDKHGIKL